MTSGRCRRFFVFGPGLASFEIVNGRKPEPKGGNGMKYNENRVDETILALLHLTTFRESSGYRTWKGHDWEVMNRLHNRGFIGNPKSKSRSVELTEEGRLLSDELFKKHFSEEG